MLLLPVLKLDGPINNTRVTRLHPVQMVETRQPLGGTEHQITTVAQIGVNSTQNILLQFSREVNQHIAAKYDIELSQCGKTVHQVETPKTNQRTELWLYLPAIVINGVKKRIKRC